MATSTCLDLSGRRVLIIEDEPMVASTLQDMFEELGAEVVGPVCSAEEALPLLDAQQIDVATLDVSLKGGLAYGLAAALRNRGIPFVFVTGRDRVPDRPPDLIDVPWVAKPFSYADLCAAVATAIVPA